MTNKKLKILMVASTYPFDSSDPQPRFIQGFASSLSDDCDISVLVPSSPRVCKDFDKEQPFTVHRFRYMLRRWERISGGDGLIANLRAEPLLILLLPFFVVSQFLWLVWLARKNDVDIVHAHWIIPQGLIAVLARPLLRRNTKVLVTAHGGDLFGLDSPFFRRLKKWVLRRADHISVVSNAMKQKCVSDFNLAETKVFVRSMGVDLTNRFTPSSKPRTIDIVFVGRLVPKKGLSVLLRALGIIVDEGFAPTVDVIGGGNDLAFYVDQASKLGLDGCVKFRGAIANERVPEFISTARVAVFPFVIASDGDQEGLGLTTVEAMGCKCLVIASGVEAVKDVVQHGENGFLFPPGDSKQLANIIKKALYELPENEKDRIVQNGRLSSMQKFDWSAVSRDYIQFYAAITTRN